MSKSKEEVILESAIGFAGDVPHGLHIHPGNEHLIYPLGSTVVIKNLKTKKQVFLRGHTDRITCLAVSKSGKYIATGQQSHMKAPMYIWDFEAAISGVGDNVYHKLKPTHQKRVQSLAFSAEDTYLASVGGEDDGKLVIWSVKRGKTLHGVNAAKETTLTLAYYNEDECMLVTAGFYNIRCWNFDPDTYDLTHTEMKTGNLRRVFKSLAISEDDSSCYAGTTTGDLLRFSLTSNPPLFKTHANELFSCGICAICVMEPYLLLGNGDGTIVRLDRASLKRASRRLKKTPENPHLMGRVTSLSPMFGGKGKANGFYCGTSESNIYNCRDVETMRTELKASCHFGKINDLCFMENESRIFVTCSKDLRVWNAQSQQELLRVNVANEECLCLAVPNSGELILTGWTDGKIRAFKPISGELSFVINDAHPEGVTAINVTNDNNIILSGGQEGQVRFWSMSHRRGHTMLASLKEHKSKVTALAVRDDDNECVSSSTDGSSIVWNLKDFVRSKAMFANTMFNSILYHPDESQFLTCGSDRQLAYWGAYDGEKIRIVEGSNREINAMCIDRDGLKFACGGNDMMVRIFDYDDGDLNAVGEGHSDAINSVKISPDGQKIVSVGSEGGIFIWKNPYPTQDPTEGKAPC